ncbi:MAG: hypothetical protein ACOX8E_01020 [Ruminococcus sp.]
MLNSILESHALFYTIALLTGIGAVWLLMVNAFYDRTIRDMGRMDTPKSKWMKEFIKTYQMKTIKNEKIQNAEAFIRTQMIKGKSFGVFVYRLRRWSGYCGLASIILMGLGLYGTYIYAYSETARYQYLMAGALSALVLLLLRPFLCFGQKEDMILDGLTDYIENRTVSAEKPEVVPVEKEDRDSLAAQVTEGIRQTAASSTKFSQFLTPEEEDIMREVIKEYLT